MAFTCYQPIADKSISNLDFQLSKPPASSDTIAFHSLSSGCKVDPSKEAEISDSDDDSLPSVREIIARSKSTIDLTLDDDDAAGDKNAIETASNPPTPPPCISPSQKSPAHPTDDRTTSSAVVTPGRKPYPWKNVPPWSPLYHKLQQHFITPLHNHPIVESLALHAGTDSLGSAPTELERPPKDSGGPVAEQPENSPEIPETPTVTFESVRRGASNHSDNDDGDHSEAPQSVTDASMVAGGGNLKVNRGSSFVRHRPYNEYDTGSAETDNLQSTDQTDLIASTNSSGEAHLSIARFSEQDLALMAVSPSSLSDVREDGLVIVDISKLTTVKVLDKRSRASGVEYRCELEPLWLAAGLVERARMERVHIRSYENGVVRDRRLKTLRVGKRKFSEI